MKKIFTKLLTCAVILTAVLSLSQIKAMADSKNYSTSISLSKSDDYETFEFDMPKDGTIKVNASIKDTDTIPGTLTITIQKDNKEGSPKVKEIAGITAGTPVTDLAVELSQGTYYFCYKLSNAAGDLSSTSISLQCTAEILPTVIANISELKLNNISSFEGLSTKGYSELKFGDGEGSQDIVIPFTAKNSGIYLSMVPGEEQFEAIKGAIYKDKECTKAVGKSFSLGSTLESASFLRSLPGGGTYYVKFTLENTDYEPVGETSFFVKLYGIDTADRALTFGKATLAYQDKDGKKINYMITAKTAGVITIDVTPADNSAEGTATFCLLDKNKKAITKKSTAYSKQEDGSNEYGAVEKYYTVPAGTYYIQVTASNSVYELAGSFEKWKSNAGTGKTKAKLVKVQKTYGIGYLTTADKETKTDWYKFTADSNQYIQVVVTALLDGKFDYEVLDSKGKVIYKLSKNVGSKEGYYMFTLEGNFSKGNYYIKVNKTGASSSLAYTLLLYNYKYVK